MAVLSIYECVAFGVLGGIVYVLVDYLHRKRVELELLAIKRYAIRVILGGIVGLLFYFSGFPNHLNCFTSGYVAPDFLAKLVERGD